MGQLRKEFKQGVFTMHESNRIQFRDNALYIYSSADGQLDIVADTTIALSGAITQTYSSASTGNMQECTATMTGAGTTGGRALFQLNANAALGGWANALKGVTVFSTAGKVSGLGSAICGEIQLSSFTTAGTYAALEAEIVVGASGSLGAGTSFIYMNFDTTGEAAANAGCFLFDLGANVNAASGEMFDSSANTAGAQIDHSLKIRVDGSTMFIPLMDNADGS